MDQTKKHYFRPCSPIVVAVIAANSVSRTISEVKKNWSNPKSNNKEHIALHRLSVSATGWGTGTPDLSPFDERLASIIREASVASVVTEKEAEDETTYEPGKQPKALCIVHQT